MDRPVYRIIDANFNRAREAVRVMEEFCRFALNSGTLTSRAKQLRHELAAAVDKLDTAKLIACRDTPGDVGVGQTVENQLARTDLSDCFTAAAKRLTEALRALAETTQTINPQIARAIETLRYTAYTLEKDITLFADPAEKFKAVGLYVIITSSLPADVISLTHRCIEGGADCIQLRAKNIEDDQFLALAGEFAKTCADANTISMINDRADIAIAANAAGVHLGQNDLPVRQARNLATSPLIIGKSTHSPDQLKAAWAEMPTYVALGPVFPTDTKPTTKPVGLQYIEQAAEILAENLPD